MTKESACPTEYWLSKISCLAHGDWTNVGFVVAAYDTCGNILANGTDLRDTWHSFREEEWCQTDNKSCLSKFQRSEPLTLHRMIPFSPILSFNNIFKVTSKQSKALVRRRLEYVHTSLECSVFANSQTQMCGDNMEYLTGYPQHLPQWHRAVARLHSSWEYQWLLTTPLAPCNSVSGLLVPLPFGEIARS
jgi:hypothetical protein